MIAWHDARNAQICISVNNGTADCAAATLTSHPYTAQFSLGALSGTANKLNGSVRFVGLWSKELAPEERTELYDNQAALTYPLKDDTTSRTSFLLQNYHFFDNRGAAWAGAEVGAYFYSLPYSRAIYTTSATSMDVEVYNNTSAGGLSEAADARQINVRVNGENYALVVPSGSTGAASTHTVALPPGLKTVEVWTGLQTLHGTTVVGTWLRKITFNAAAQIKTPSNKSPKILIYGDSISIGGGADNPVREGWTMLLRDAWPGSLAVEGWGGRLLYRDAGNPSLRADFVQKIVTQNPDYFWAAIGTNDYGGPSFGEMSASDFGTAYAAALDDLHAALPALKIYAQSPLPRTTESANTFGNTLSQYRTQIQTVCAARSWCTFADGTSFGFSTSTDLDDTVHPNNAGHVKYFGWVRAFFGL